MRSDLTIGAEVRVTSIGTRTTPAPIGVIEGLDVLNGRGVLVRFAELVHGADHCVATREELEVIGDA